METHQTEGKTFIFKTNINCATCLANVTPALNAAEGICHWNVDIAGKDKILTVHSEGITEAEIKEAVQSAGYRIEPINS